MKILTLLLSTFLVVGMTGCGAPPPIVPIGPITTVLYFIGCAGVLSTTIFSTAIVWKAKIEEKIKK